MVKVRWMVSIFCSCSFLLISFVPPVISAAAEYGRIIVSDTSPEIPDNMKNAQSPVNFERISSSFSKSRRHPILKSPRAHNGADYVAQKGAPVSAMADGQILTAGYQRGYGKLVIIRHPDGYKTVYGHLSKIAKEVRKGSDVTQGQIIGFVGSTGLSTGPHLHYETRVSDRPVNPLKVKIPKGQSVPEARITAQAKAGGETDGPLIIERRGNRYVRIQ